MFPGNSDKAHRIKSWDDYWCTLEFRLKAAAKHEGDHFSRYSWQVRLTEEWLLRLIKNQLLLFTGSLLERRKKNVSEGKVDYFAESVRKVCKLFFSAGIFKSGLEIYLFDFYLKMIFIRGELSDILDNHEVTTGRARRTFSLGGFCEWCLKFYGSEETKRRQQLLFHIWQ